MKVFSDVLVWVVLLQEIQVLASEIVGEIDAASRGKRGRVNRRVASLCERPTHIAPMASAYRSASTRALLRLHPQTSATISTAFVALLEPVT
jgi:hypothetical protein